MGRMSDARRRAQQKAGQGGETSPPGAAETPAAPPLPPEPPPEDETMVFPDEGPPAPVPSGRISLPSSGTAEEILARADAARVAVVTASAPPPAPLTPVPETPAAPAPVVADTSSSRTHNISFFAAPNREERKAVEITEHLATFFLAGEEYAADVRLVQEIIRIPEITQLPRAPEFIKGVINLRGRIIPVVDLKRKLGLGDVEMGRQARIVVVKLRDRLVGLLVDGASQVLKIPVSAIEAAPEEVGEIEAGYIRGVAKLESRLIILVDLLKILAPELREGAGTPAAG